MLATVLYFFLVKKGLTCVSNLLLVASFHFHEYLLHAHCTRVDLEYNTVANPNINNETNERLIQEFKDELANEINAQFNISIQRKHIIDLDSSTDKKFSRHLIVHMVNGELFKDAVACGVFVKNFVGRLAEEVATGQLMKKRPTLGKYLFVFSKPAAAKISQTSTQSTATQHQDIIEDDASNMASNKTCFVDTGVYTRNRLFRLLGSSKFGKPPCAALRIASVNQFAFSNGFGNEKVYVPAMEEALLLRKIPGHDEDDFSSDEVEEVSGRKKLVVEKDTQSTAAAYTVSFKSDPLRLAIQLGKSCKGSSSDSSDSIIPWEHQWQHSYPRSGRYER